MPWLAPETCYIRLGPVRNRRVDDRVWCPCAVRLKSRKPITDDNIGRIADLQGEDAIAGLVTSACMNEGGTSVQPGITAYQQFQPVFSEDFGFGVVVNV